jgi:hypothetical protein
MSAMIDGIEAIYQRIADARVKAIPLRWVSARSEATFFSDSIDFSGEYIPTKGSPRSFKVGREITNAFEELRQRFKEAGKPLWGQAIFELQSDGKFNMKWGYDNCDENGDTIWNQEKWSRLQEERRLRLTQP